MKLKTPNCYAPFTLPLGPLKKNREFGPPSLLGCAVWQPSNTALQPSPTAQPKNEGTPNDLNIAHQPVMCVGTLEGRSATCSDMVGHFAGPPLNAHKTLHITFPSCAAAVARYNIGDMADKYTTCKSTQVTHTHTTLHLVPEYGHHPT